MDTQILQWNVRGLLHNLDDIRELLNKHTPKVLCVQETHLKSTQTNFLKQYAIFRKDRDDAAASSGGVAIIVDKGVACKQLNLRTSLEAVAVRAVLFGKLLTITSIYIPPCYQLSKTQFQSFIDELPPPYIVVGDLNAHNPLWGDSRLDARGRLIEHFLFSSGACLLNKKEPTYYSTTHNTYSSIDLSIVSSTLIPYLEWSVVKNPFGSDHFPIMLKLTKEDTCSPDFPRWNTKSANWELFRESTFLDGDDIGDFNIDDAVAYLTAFIIDAAVKCIKQTNGMTNKRRIPWWNDDCRKARNSQNKAWRLLRNYPTAENLVNFKQVKSQARRTRRLAKKESWNRYISGINSYTDETKVWNRVNKLMGRESHPLPLVNSRGESLEEQADCLGEHFEYVSSASHYTETFLRFKEREERQPLKCKRPSSEAYNCPFTLAELKASLACCNNSAPGGDRIMYEMIKYLHPEALKTLLTLYNTMWAAGYIPLLWKEAIVIPVLKQGKDPSLAASYRPIALTSCLCKLYEKMVNRRLIHFLESNSILDPLQCGFREGRSTIDHLVRIETYIRDAFIHKQVVLSVFLDLEKAYDTTWRFGILRDLAAMGIHGNMLNTIESYLSNRTFRVKVGNALSRSFTQETGVPQGGVLSCTLFLVKMNSLQSVIPSAMFYSVYVDDVQMSFKSCNMSICERQVQLGMNKFSKWADENGFKINTQKSTCVLFSNKRGVMPLPSIAIKGDQLSVSSEHKFLGTTLDSKLTFIPHIKYVKMKCLKAMNVLKLLSRTTWGSDRKCLLKLYKSLVWSRLDYASIIYHSATPSALKILDPVHHLGIRLATGAFRTSPIQSLYVESNQWSLHLQRSYSSFIYFIKVRANIKHPSYSTINDMTAATLFHNRPAARKPFSLRVRNLSEEMDVPLLELCPMPTAKLLPPWQWQLIHCDTSFVEITKHAPEAHIKMHFRQLQSNYSCVEFYTDASKSHAGVAYAAVGPSFSESGVLHPETSIFTAEGYALLSAVKHIRKSNIQKSVIFTDSLSVVNALKSLFRFKNPVIIELYSVLCTAYMSNQHVTICWVPGHRSIEGNVLADQMATSIILRAINPTATVPATDLKPFLRKKLRSHWQRLWDTEINNKLHLIKPQLGYWPSATRTRRTDVLFCRLRIGHTYGTHSFLLTGDEPPTCGRCGERLTVLHVLLECPEAERERKKYFPLAYRYHLPLHPIMFLGEEPLFDAKSVLGFLKDVVLNVFSPTSS